MSRPQGRRPLSMTGGLGRRAPSRRPRDRFLLFLEGQKTENDYFRYVRQKLRDSLIVLEISGERGDPLGLVEAAVLKRNQAFREAQRQRDDNLKYDQTWCVVDVDSHPRLQEAKVLAEAESIGLAISNPCFEIWPILHFRSHGGYLASYAQAREVLKRHIPDYDKGLDCTHLAGGYEVARDRATVLLARHEENGKPGGNPSTTVHHLLEAILISARASKRSTGAQFNL